MGEGEGGGSSLSPPRCDGKTRVGVSLTSRLVDVPDILGAVGQNLSPAPFPTTKACLPDGLPAFLRGVRQDG